MPAPRNEDRLLSLLRGLRGFMATCTACYSRGSVRGGIGPYCGFVWIKTVATAWPSGATEESQQPTPARNLAHGAPRSSSIRTMSRPRHHDQGIAIQTHSAVVASLAVLRAFTRNKNHQPRASQSQIPPNNNRQGINHFAPCLPANPPPPGYTRLSDRGKHPNRAMPLNSRLSQLWGSPRT